MFRKSLIYGFVILFAAIISMAIATYADDAKAEIKYEIKNIEISWDNGIEGVHEMLERELKILSDEGNCIYDAVPYVTSSPQAQFPFSKTTSISIIYNKCEKGNFVDVRRYIYQFRDFEHFYKVLQAINQFEYKPIFVPIVDQCGVLQTYAFGCTKWLLAIEIEVEK